MDIDYLATNVGPQDGATQQQWAALVFIDAGLITAAIDQHPAAVRDCLQRGWIVRDALAGYVLTASAPRLVSGARRRDA